MPPRGRRNARNANNANRAGAGGNNQIAGNNNRAGAANDANQGPAPKRRKLALNVQERVAPTFEQDTDHAAWVQALAIYHLEKTCRARMPLHANAMLINTFELCARKKIAAKTGASGSSSGIADRVSSLADSALGSEVTGTPIGSFGDGVQNLILEYMGAEIGFPGGPAFVPCATAAELCSIKKTVDAKAVNHLAQAIIKACKAKVSEYGSSGVQLQSLGAPAAQNTTESFLRRELPEPLLQRLRYGKTKGKWSEINKRYPSLLPVLESAGFRCEIRDEPDDSTLPRPPESADFLVIFWSTDP